MPWNDNANPGPWGTPPSSNDDEPRLTPGRRAPSPPPPPKLSFVEYARRARKQWSRLTRGRRAERMAARMGALGATGILTLWIISGFYVVDSTDRAVVSRLGSYVRTEAPGLRYHLPSPIENADLVNVTQEQSILIGGGGSDSPTEGLMPTGDGNLVDLYYSIQYHVADPVAWLYRARDPEVAIRTAAESAMREVVGRSDLASLLSDPRSIQPQVLALAQSQIGRLQAGALVDQVRIQKAAPPAQAAAAAQDVVTAGQDAKTAVGAATAYAAKTQDQASAAAAKIAQAATAYQEQVVHEANGEASRFNQVYAQYRQAPAVTRERIYLQTMEDVLAHAHTVILGAKGTSPQIVLSPQTGAPNPPAAAANHGSGNPR